MEPDAAAAEQRVRALCVFRGQRLGRSRLRRR